jgi:hypothetical protein
MTAFMDRPRLSASFSIFACSASGIRRFNFAAARSSRFRAMATYPLQNYRER